jgi:3-(methylthio)propanoyl-CoA dehydrogenase
VWVLRTWPEMPGEAHASAVPLLRLAGLVCGGWQLARAALIVAKRQTEGDDRVLSARITTACFFADHLLSQADGLAHCVMHGAVSSLSGDLEPV